MKTEHRCLWDLRSQGDRAITGTVVRYGDKAKVAGFTETILPGAFGNIGDVMLNIGHDGSKLIARAGGGLVLADSAERLELRADVANTTDGNDALELVRTGVLRGFSVEMRVLEDHWQGTHRTVKRAELKDIGLVARPAYADSEVALRAKQTADEAPPAQDWVY